ncbi:MAG TPA: TonB-dependent receptor [Sphingomicrobium sp.]|nr:TonB-dependent receptor [Sphingomicrobium sp.]
MTKFARSLYATTSSHVAMGVALAVLGASPAFAQDVAAEASAAAATTAAQDPAEEEEQPTADAQQEGETIVVTGFRASLQSAVNTKKRQDRVVESVSAEDIGKLPDNSIAESIARLPGLAAQRAYGRATIISIRGFGPDFSVTTLNGREQTTTNDSRAVEFDQFPSEILNQVVVYKTPSADMVSQGLVGTVDLRTIRPLDSGKRIVAIGGRGSYIDQKLQPDSREFGYRAYATYVDQFADDMIGVALSASYTNEPYQTRDWNAWGYSDYNGAQLMTGVKMWHESSDFKRLGLNGTVQARLSDNLTMTVDGFYSNFKEHIDKRGFEFPDFPAWGFSTLTNATVEDGLTTGGTFNDVWGVIENYRNDRDADLYSLGWNAAWDGQNGWKGFADVSWSRTDRVDRRLETTMGSGRAHSGITDDITFNWTGHGPEFGVGLDYSDPSMFFLTDVHGWSGALNQAGYWETRTTKDDLWQARAEIERELGAGFLDTVKVGLAYTDRSKKLVAEEAFLTPAGGVDEIAVPSDLLLDPVKMDRGIGPIIAYNPWDLLDRGILDFIPNNFGEGKGYKVVEKLFQPYVMATIKAEWGSTDITGNIGLQAIHTDQSSTGPTYTNGVPTIVTVGTKYWEWLPSLNLSFRMPNDWVIRFAASKQIMRPRMPQLSSTINYSTDNVNYLPERIIVGGGGNPFLKPYKATGVDLNIEKYFGSKGYIALQTFYKHMDRYIAGGQITDFDYSDYPPPADPPTTNIGILNTEVNTKGGYIYGFEFAGTLPFETFTPSLDGFGLTGGVGYTKTKVKGFTGDYVTIPGYSKWVANLTAFYEKYGFNVRGSMRYRSKFQGDFVLYSGGLERQNVLEETVFDAQVGYDFQPGSRFEGLSLYLQGQNLTNERQATVNGVVPNDFMKYQTYGRRFLAGFTYKF